MNLEHDTNLERRNPPPWVFSVETRIHPKSVSDKEILNCAIYQRVSRDLTKQLFETKKLLRDSLQGGLSVQLDDMKLEHVDLEVRFDRAVCSLTLAHRGPARFVLETQFFLKYSLVTTATQAGLLYFEELN
jgi:hypothetical protein